MPETTTTTMPTNAAASTVTIDGTVYQTDKLSDAVKQQLANLQIVDLELARLNIQVTIAQTARAAFGVALREALTKQEK